jgi:hypothetical protein
MIKAWIVIEVRLARVRNRHALTCWLGDGCEKVHTLFGLTISPD